MSRNAMSNFIIGVTYKFKTTPILNSDGTYVEVENQENK